MYPFREVERGERYMDGSSDRDYRGMGSLLSTDEDSNMLLLTFREFKVNPVV